MNTAMRWLSLVGILLVAGACARRQPKAPPSFDSTLVPAGAGWFCHAVNDPGGPARGVCFRSEAECYVDKNDTEPRSTNRCEVTAKAYCIHIAKDSHLHCYTNTAGCDEFRRNYEGGYSISPCVANR